VARQPRSAGVRERHHDEIPDLRPVDVVADGLDDADRLVAHTAAGLAALHCLVRPQIAAADAGTSDPQEGVGRVDQAGVGNALDKDVAGTVHGSCSHVETTFPLWFMLNVAVPKKAPDSAE
jgi:hypothetical protein